MSVAVVSNLVEEWRPITGFIRYEVSSLGRFRRRFTGAILRGKNCNGYTLIGLMRDGVQFTKTAHRIVAITFLGDPPPGKPIVNHINRVRHDNRVANLEWISYSGNALHALAR